MRRSNAGFMAVSGIGLALGISGVSVNQVSGQCLLMRVTGEDADYVGSAVGIHRPLAMAGAPGARPDGETLELELDSRWRLGEVLRSGLTGPAGHSVLLDASQVFIGAPAVFDDSGAVDVFRRAGDAWVFVERLRAANTWRGDVFGFSIARSETQLFIGAPQLDGQPDDNRGGVYQQVAEGMAEGIVQGLVRKFCEDSTGFRLPYDCTDCGLIYDLRTRCRSRNGAWRVSGVLFTDVPAGREFVFSLDGGPPCASAVNERGKAKCRWETSEGGTHEIEVLTCSGLRGSARCAE